LSKGEWVRRALRDAIRHSIKGVPGSDPVVRLAALHGPAADIDQMLDEIEAGRA
jgi:hypothetical protein